MRVRVYGKVDGKTYYGKWSARKDAIEGLTVFNMDKSYAYTMGTLKRTSSIKSLKV